MRKLLEGFTSDETKPLERLIMFSFWMEENATITGHFGFVVEESSVRKITYRYVIV